MYIYQKEKLKKHEIKVNNSDNLAAEGKIFH